MSKLPVLSCRLKVGNKYCVEKLWEGEEGQNKFQWMTLQEVHQLSQSLGYENDITPTFTIGINPAHGDYIIGQKYEISNNINESFNLDKTGMAIPITLDDGLSGTIEFEILGPYNGIWDTHSYNVNAEWYKWLYGDYEANSKSVLAYTSSIMVNNLKIEMATDNAGVSSEKGGPDNDLVYYSVTNPTYVEKQEDDIDIFGEIEERRRNNKKSIYCTQTVALMKKTFIVLYRHYKTTILVLSSPITTCVILILLQLALQTWSTAFIEKDPPVFDIKK
jgi:hypothetical protein